MSEKRKYKVTAILRVELEVAGNYRSHIEELVRRYLRPTVHPNRTIIIVDDCFDAVWIFPKELEGEPCEQS